MPAKTLPLHRGLLLIADDAYLTPDGWRRLARACRALPLSVQLRQKPEGDRRFLQNALRLRRLCRRTGCFFWVNDRPDIALLAGADGVHLGQDDLPPQEVRQRFKLAVGLSTHTLGQVAKSAKLPLAYIGFGPVFRTRTKASSYKPRGLALLRRAIKSSRHPVIAIGGMTADSAPEALEAGAYAAAVARDFFLGDEERLISGVRQAMARLG